MRAGAAASSSTGKPAVRIGSRMPDVLGRKTWWLPTSRRSPKAKSFEEVHVRGTSGIRGSAARTSCWWRGGPDTGCRASLSFENNRQNRKRSAFGSCLVEHGHAHAKGIPGRTGAAKADRFDAGAPMDEELSTKPSPPSRIMISQVCHRMRTTPRPASAARCLLVERHRFADQIRSAANALDFLRTGRAGGRNS